VILFFFQAAREATSLTAAPIPLPDAREVGVLEGNRRILLDGDRRDPGAHEAGTEYSQRLDPRRASGASPSMPGSLLERPSVAKKRNMSSFATSLIASSPKERDSTR
jgi:hypothetical protein